MSSAHGTGASLFNPLLEVFGEVTSVEGNGCYFVQL